MKSCNNVSVLASLCLSVMHFCTNVCVCVCARVSACLRSASDYIIPVVYWQDRPGSGQLHLTWYTHYKFTLIFRSLYEQHILFYKFSTYLVSLLVDKQHTIAHILLFFYWVNWNISMSCWWWMSCFYLIFVSQSPNLSFYSNCWSYSYQLCFPEHVIPFLNTL